jgi:hypothetical protein
MPKEDKHLGKIVKKEQISYICTKDNRRHRIGTQAWKDHINFADKRSIVNKLKIKPEVKAPKLDLELITYQLLEEYSKKSKVPKIKNQNYFILVNKKGNRHVRSLAGKKTWAKRVNRRITINLSIFERIAEKNQNDAIKILKYTLAHEVAHYNYHSEGLANVEAEIHSGISLLEADRLWTKYWHLGI